MIALGNVGNAIISITQELSKVGQLNLLKKSPVILIEHERNDES